MPNRKLTDSELAGLAYCYGADPATERTALALCELQERRAASAEAASRLQKMPSSAERDETVSADSVAKIGWD